MEQKRTVGQATASLILGILSLIVTGILTAIPAVICGHIAKSKIKQNPQHLQGEGQAIAGLVMGYLTIAVSILIIPLMIAIAIPAFVTARDSAQEASCKMNLRIIEQAKDQHALEHASPEGEVISAEQLNVYLDSSFEGMICPGDGDYTISPIGTDPACSVHGSRKPTQFR